LFNPYGRYADNFDTINNFFVVRKPATKADIASYGSPQDFLKEVSYLLGQQSFDGANNGRLLCGRRSVLGLHQPTEISMPLQGPW
jgi:hypothetical protein